jgi:hypothetical protein
VKRGFAELLATRAERPEKLRQSKSYGGAPSADSLFRRPVCTPARRSARVLAHRWPQSALIAARLIGKPIHLCHGSTFQTRTSSRKQMWTIPFLVSVEGRAGRRGRDGGRFRMRGEYTGFIEVDGSPRILRASAARADQRARADHRMSVAGETDDDPGIVPVPPRPMTMAGSRGGRYG